MRQKQYKTKRARKLDRLMGCVAFPLFSVLAVIAVIASLQLYAMLYDPEFTGVLCCIYCLGWVMWRLLG
ncbi:MAG: hypothetical protein IPL28_07365 [Chloroflexi bacterium]|nr:hypothetical protein [Chloroflexota bacterium]